MDICCVTTDGQRTVKHGLEHIGNKRPIKDQTTLSWGVHPQIPEQTENAFLTKTCVGAWGDPKFLIYCRTGLGLVPASPFLAMSPGAIKEMCLEVRAQSPRPLPASYCPPIGPTPVTAPAARHGRSRAAGQVRGAGPGGRSAARCVRVRRLGGAL